MEFYIKKKDPIRTLWKQMTVFVPMLRRYLFNECIFKTTFEPHAVQKYTPRCKIMLFCALASIPISL